MALLLIAFHNLFSVLDYERTALLSLPKRQDTISPPPLFCAANLSQSSPGYLIYTHCVSADIRGWKLGYFVVIA